ncbi:MAG TPA: GEVED domain-containing protein [Propionibacteriaceae bacterium]|nr:GEVED domain-containing protein [Propionibacteriaceae bacterium]
MSRGAVAGLVSLILCLGAAYAPTAAAVELLDLGDAPSSYDAGPDGPAAAAIGGPRLGRKLTADPVNPETGASVNSSESASGDDSDDAVDEIEPLPAGQLRTFTQAVAVSEIKAPARLCGWIDFDRNEEFRTVERACADVAAGASQASLSWLGRPTKAGLSFVRLRIDSAAAQAERPTGTGSTGEIEDYAVRFVAAAPADRAEFTLVKTATPRSVSRVGDVVTYRLLATNTGTVDLTGVQISDELPGLEGLTCSPAQPADLEPGNNLDCSATRVTTQDDLDFGSIDNFARVFGDAPKGDPDDETDDIAALDDAAVDAVQRPRLVLTTEASAATAQVGDRLKLTFTARNAGNVTLSRVRVSSALKVSGLTCTTAGTSLAPGESMTCVAGYRVRGGDVRADIVRAKGMARAESPYGETDRPSDDVVATDTTRLTVVGGGGAGPTQETKNPPSAHDPLAATGGEPLWLIVGLLTLSAAGTALIMVGRRRARRLL